MQLITSDILLYSTLLRKYSSRFPRPRRRSRDADAVSHLDMAGLSRDIASDFSPSRGSRASPMSSQRDRGFDPLPPPSDNRQRILTLPGMMTLDNEDAMVDRVMSGRR